MSEQLSAVRGHDSFEPLIVVFIASCLFLPLAAGLSSYYSIQSVQFGIFFLLGLLVFAVVVRAKSVAAEDRMLQVLVWSVSISLILASASFSQYLTGWDIQREFSIFQEVLAAGRWNPENSLFYNSAISISIFPTMVADVSNLGAQEIFKFTYPLIYSVVPVVLYKIYRRMLSPRSAFLSTYLFMSYWPFYTEIIQIGKTEIAEVLLVVLLLSFMSKIHEKRVGAAIVSLLTLGIVLSHYTLSFIYVLFVGSSLIASRITRRVVAVCSWLVVFVTSVMVFAWYSFVAGGSAVFQLSSFVLVVTQGIMRDFLNPSSRPLVALQAAGLAAVTPGFLHDLYRLTNYVVQFCMLVGFVILVGKKSKNLAEKKMLPLITVALAFIGSAIILPFFGGIPFPRIYHYGLLFISPCFVIGAKLLESWLRRAHALLTHNLGEVQFKFSSRGRMIVPAAILLSYFLFTSGWVWAVSLDSPTSLILDSRRLADNPGSTSAVYYTDTDLPADVNGAFWLRWHGGTDHLCSDAVSRDHALNAYGERDSELLRDCNLQKSYVFMSELNLLHGIATELQEPFGGSVLLEPSPLGLLTGDLNRLYSNGGAAVYAGIGLLV